MELLAEFVGSIRYRGRVFNAILYFASEEGAQSLPNSEEDILLNMARAVVQYCGGDKEEAPSCTGPYNPNWDQRLDEAVDRALKNNDLGPDLTPILKHLLNVEYRSDELGESSWQSGMRNELLFMQRGMGETFSLTHPKVLSIQQNIKLHMTPADLEHCKQIGLLMRKNILAAKTG